MDGHLIKFENGVLMLVGNRKINNTFSVKQDTTKVWGRVNDTNFSCLLTKVRSVYIIREPCDVVTVATNVTVNVWDLWHEEWSGSHIPNYTFPFESGGLKIDRIDLILQHNFMTYNGGFAPMGSRALINGLGEIRTVMEYPQLVKALLSMGWGCDGVIFGV